MFQINIRGSAAVFHGEDDSDSKVTIPEILRSLDGLVYDEERFTDYLGGTAEEDELASLVEPGGAIRFEYREGSELLTAITEYCCHVRLSGEQLKLLTDYTMGQWSDGIGENWACSSSAKCGYMIMCLTMGDGVGPKYPLVEVLEK